MGTDPSPELDASVRIFLAICASVAMVIIMATWHTLT